MHLEIMWIKIKVKVPLLLNKQQIKSLIKWQKEEIMYV